jgi:hypothetical protein
MVYGPGVQADPTRNIVEGPAASTDKVAETANGVIEDTADSSCQLRLEGTATQLHQCRSVADANTMAKAANGVIEDTADSSCQLRQKRLNSRSSCQLRLEGTATLLHQCRPVAGANTMAEKANGIFEDTADGIVV